MTHYVVVRKDLPLGFLAAQVVHAAGESSDDLVPSGTNAVVLCVPDESSLLSLETRLCEAAVSHYAIREPDAPYLGAITAIGFPPCEDRSRLKPFLGDLPLLK